MVTGAHVGFFLIKAHKGAILNTQQDPVLRGGSGCPPPGKLDYYTINFAACWWPFILHVDNHRIYLCWNSSLTKGSIFFEEVSENNVINSIREDKHKSPRSLRSYTNSIYMPICCPDQSLCRTPCVYP